MSQYLNPQPNNSVLSSISGNTDGLEGLITISNGLLTQISGFTDQVEDNQISGNTILTDINQNTFNIISGITESNDLLFQIEINTNNISTGVTDINQHLLDIETYLDGLESLISGGNTILSDLYSLQTGCCETLTQIEQNTFDSATGITEVNQNLIDIKSSIDGVETLISGTNNLLSNLYDQSTGDSLLLQQIEQNTFDSATGITTTNQHLINIEGYLDGVESLISGGNSLLSDLYSLQTGCCETLTQIEQNTFDSATGITETNQYLANIDSLISGTNDLLLDLYNQSTGDSLLLQQIEQNTFDSATGITETNQHLLNVEGYLDEVESLISGGNALLSDLYSLQTGCCETLTQIEQNTFDSATGITETNQHLINIEGYLDEVESLLSGLSYSLSGSTTGVTVINTIFNPVNVALPPTAMSINGSIETSERTLLALYVMDKDNNSLLLDRASNVGGTHLYLNRINTQSVALNGAFAITQSFQRHPYYTGVPQRIELTFDNFQLETDVIKEAGYYQTSTISPYNTDYDGIYLESDGSANTYNFCIANDGVITKIPRSNWDDKLDGTTASGVILDFSKFTIAVIEFLYLGGSCARLGFLVGDSLYWAHTYEHSNVNTGTIIGSPHQPIRWSIRSVGGTGSLRQICGSVSSMGKISHISRQRSASTFATMATDSLIINANTQASCYMVRAIRLVSGAKNAIITGVYPAVWSQTSDDLYAHIILNPTFVNAPTWNVIPNSNVEMAYGDTTTSTGKGSLTRISNGIILDTIPISNTNREANKSAVGDILQRIGMGIDGTRQVIAVAVQVTQNGTNADVYGTLNFSEV